MMLFFILGCVKTYILNGQIRDSNGRPVSNALVKIEGTKFETKSDKKGRFNLQVKYNKKNEPYSLDVVALAHRSKSVELFFEEEKEIRTKMVLEPKVIFLPYRRINIDIENLESQYPPIESLEEPEEEYVEEVEVEEPPPPVKPKKNKKKKKKSKEEKPKEEKLKEEKPKEEKPKEEKPKEEKPKDEKPAEEKTDDASKEETNNASDDDEDAEDKEE